VVWRPDEVVTVHELCGGNLDRGLAGLHSEDGGNCTHAGHAVVWSCRLIMPCTAEFGCGIKHTASGGAEVVESVAWLAGLPGRSRLLRAA
jgi:hypothetical protein